MDHKVGLVIKYFIIEDIIIIGESRTDDISSVEKEINTHKPTHIMTFVGRTHGEGINTIDYLEKPGKLKDNIRDNLFSQISIALLANTYNIHYLCFGTGCIFEDYTDQPIFDENSEPNFFGSSYSTVKGFTDRLLHQHPFNKCVLNVRIRMPITADFHPRNFITKIINYEKVCSFPNSMTVLPELLPLMIDMARRKEVGTINLTNPGSISHEEILNMYKEIINPEFKYTLFSLEDQTKILASGRSNNHLNTTKLETMYPEVLNIKDAVRKAIYGMKEHYNR